MMHPPPRSTLFPYTTLFRSNRSTASKLVFLASYTLPYNIPASKKTAAGMIKGRVLDPKSTRLNSSHVRSSYAVLGLRKKNAPRSTRSLRSQDLAGDGDGAVADKVLLLLLSISPGKSVIGEGKCSFHINDAPATEIDTLSLHDALPI